MKTSNETALRSGMMVMFDDGMMSDGNGGGDVVCGGFLQWCVCVLVCCGISYGSWYCMAVGFCF
jgi:predicted membrane protein